MCAPAPMHYRGDYFEEILELVIRAGSALQLSYYNGQQHVRDVKLLTKREETRLYIECDDPKCKCHQNRLLHTCLSRLRGCSSSNTYDNFRDKAGVKLSSLVNHVTPVHVMKKVLFEAHGTLGLRGRWQDATILISRLRSAKPTTIAQARPLALSVVKEFYKV